MNLGLDVGSMCNSFFERGYIFSYDLRPFIADRDEQRQLYSILKDNGIDCELLFEKIYFKIEDDLNILKMVL